MRNRFRKGHTAQQREGGSIDLPSIMVGSILSLLLAGVAAVSIVTVTTSSNNNAARSTAEMIAMAQKEYFSANDRFGSQAELLAAGAMKGLDPASYCISTASNGASFVGASKTSKGRLFTVTEPNPNSVKDVADDDPSKYCFP